MKMVFSCSQPQFAVLPPVSETVSDAFHDVQFSTRRHDELLAQMQRLRGQVYLQDGAITQDALTSDGRHATSVDHHSWHVLSLDHEGKVVACLRYLEERSATVFDDLLVRHAALAQCPVAGVRFRRSVERAMSPARQMRIGFGEVGGWAVAEERRHTLESLRIILATYGLLQLLGSAAGVATATVRHGSSTILRRIGLTALQADGEDLAPYYDPNYSCEMEVLQFDSRFPNPKYLDQVRQLSMCLANAPVICRETRAPEREIRRLWGALEPVGVQESLASSLAGI